MLKVPEHQVAGHKAINGQLGPLVDDSGRFYKPLQGDERGSTELAFYNAFSSDKRIPDHIRGFFPVFHGTQLVEASDGSGLRPHIVLQDIVSGRVNASIMDVKIGSRTWYPQSSYEYVQRCLNKDKETTSLALGFRISGLQVYEKKQSGYWKPSKKIVQQFNADDVRSVLRKFVSSNASASKPDHAFASTVYGEILAQLKELKAWFEEQTAYHFNSCSVLMLYDEQSLLKGAEVKLVDFAHVMEGNGVIDHNFLGGLCSLIKFISDILADLNENSNGALEKDSEERSAATENGSHLQK
ncbi:inositol polyphosphate multikinase beta-like [Rutidosis leptorrhynchoides]|uniref:inositol polyphosphate multikinase beta-like n=1 Tax=Rutidosis leptorrhynchoides TaxID=125765 RepID=UPI003A99083F